MSRTRLPLLLAPLALVLTSLLAAPGDAVAGSPRTGAAAATSAEASRAIHRTLARRGLASSATIAASASAKSRRVGARTEVSCRVRVVVAATRDGQLRGETTATINGRGTYRKSGAVDASRAQRACASLVAEELAITKIAPFVAGAR